jgi:hypothetical protein
MFTLSECAAKNGIAGKKKTRSHYSPGFITQKKNVELQIYNMKQHKNKTFYFLFAFFLI